MKYVLLIWSFTDGRLQIDIQRVSVNKFQIRFNSRGSFSFNRVDASREKKI